MRPSDLADVWSSLNGTYFSSVNRSAMKMIHIERSNRNKSISEHLLAMNPSREQPRSIRICLKVGYVPDSAAFVPFGSC